jgi:feruloyl esterase
LVTGNGNFGGGINYSSMAGWIREGYAAASTDTGHRGPASATFVNDDVLIDYAHRANHETTAAAKRIINSYYGAAPRFSYYQGCSSGGRSGLVAARLYPNDFDGIAASAPNTDTSSQAFGQIWTYQALSSAPIQPQQLQLLHAAVLDACDAIDGVKDGVLENPMACQFNPGVLECRGAGDSTGCLAPAQVEAVRRVYAGPSHARTGQSIYPGLERGSERQWNAGPISFAVNYMKHLVFNDESWDPKTLNFDTHLALAKTRRARTLDVSPDLTRFTSRGGKLILTHGWSDLALPPRNFIRYYEEVMKQTRGAAQSTRLFMVPGGGHCGGGDGTSIFNATTALGTWVTTGKAPDRIEASRFTPDFKVDRTRPVCPWPQTARYKGTGSTDDAASFECRH